MKDPMSSETTQRDLANEAERWVSKMRCISACREKRQIGITYERCMSCTMDALLSELHRLREAQTAYWSPEWVEGALTEHVRALGCVCDKPLLGYRPKVGPRCRLCGTEPSTKPLPSGPDA